MSKPSLYFAGNCIQMKFASVFPAACFFSTFFAARLFVHLKINFPQFIFQSKRHGSQIFWHETASRTHRPSRAFKLARKLLLVHPLETLPSFLREMFILTRISERFVFSQYSYSCCFFPPHPLSFICLHSCASARLIIAQFTAFLNQIYVIEFHLVRFQSVSIQCRTSAGSTLQGK